MVGVARVLLVVCGVAALAFEPVAVSGAKHPQLLVINSSSDLLLLDPWSGQSQPYRAAAVANGDPFFSPDGTRVAFTKRVRLADFQGERIYSYELWVARWNGSMAHRLSKYGDDPTWSPDGKTIAFSWTGADPALGVRARAGVYLIPSNGGSARRVLPPVVGTDSVGLTGQMVPYRLTWSPDGSWIAFEAGNGAVWVVHPDGSGVRPLKAPHNGPQCSGSLRDWITYTTPQWLRDGRVAYTTSVACSTNDPHSTDAIFAVRPDGSHPVRILGPPPFHPGDQSTGVRLTSVAPDGISMTYYDSRRGGGASIRLAGRAAQLTPFGFIAWRPG
jgi:Tol biopolymer transport system component